MAGSSSSARERWAAWRVVEGVSSKCWGEGVSLGFGDLSIVGEGNEWEAYSCGTQNRFQTGKIRNTGIEDGNAVV